MRRILTLELSRIAESLVHEGMYEPEITSGSLKVEVSGDRRYRDYVSNTGDRFHELTSIIASLKTPNHTVDHITASLAGVSNT
jgi:L-2-hydroxyglutarate oxidase LhgO